MNPKRNLNTLMSTYINGPFNTVKLSDGSKKEILLFFDYHEDYLSQSSCQDLGVSTVDYLLNLSRPFDFFLETYPHTLGKKYKDYPSKYIHELQKWLAKNTVISENKVKSKINGIRLHYIDIRIDTGKYLEKVLNRIQNQVLKKLIKRYLYEVVLSIEEKLKKPRSPKRLIRLKKHLELVIMDMYTVRRIIDKEYVDRAVIYAGGFHCVHLIYFLMNYCGFSMTYNFYCKKNWKLSKDYEKMAKSFYPNPMKQCVCLPNNLM